MSFNFNITNITICREYKGPLTTDGSFSVIQERRPQIKLSFNHNFTLYRSHILHIWSLSSTNNWWNFWGICNCIFKKQDSWFYAYITANLLTWKSSFPMLILPRLTSIKQMPSISLALGWRCSLHKLKTTQRDQRCVSARKFFFGVITIK